MTRAELLWILGLSAFILGIIFWSWRSDLVDARERLARQQLSFLAGQIRFAMENQGDDVDQWPALMAGPGEQPEALQQLKPASLEQVLPDYTYLPSDPWLGAYALRKNDDGTWLLICLGAEQSWTAQAEPALSFQLFPPQ